VIESVIDEHGLPVFEDWLLTPEGAAIHLGQQTAVLADVHLGYEWARAAAGDCVITHSLDETLARLAVLLGRAQVAHLVVAGDLVESARPCTRTSDDVERLREWLAGRGVTMLALEGNHDRNLSRVRDGKSQPADTMSSTCTVAGWTIGHGHRPVPGKRTISGHHHPGLGVETTVAPCFLVGPGRIVLPAFSANAAGCDVGSAALPRAWLKVPLRCLASTGDELLDFGPLTELRRRLRERRAKRYSSRVGAAHR
jgi:putative SbcD/Mre11-related phosphoesterase